MPTHDQVRATILRALDELNDQLPPDHRLPKVDSTALAGPGGGLDSLGLVNLIALVEQKIEEDFRTPVNLIDEGFLGDGQAFATVGALTAFISSLMERASA
jgi:acyl carrier protein